MLLPLLIFLYFIAFLATFVVVYYLIALLLMYLPTKARQNACNTSECREVWVISNGVHTDFCLIWQELPTEWQSFIDIKLFAPSQPEYISFGWGDRGFYLETPSWVELKPKVAFKALFKLGQSVMQVVLHEELPLSSARFVARLALNHEQYQALLQHIRQSFATDEQNQAIPVDFEGLPAYEHLNYHFFEGYGQYHFFQTCNNWINQGLKKAGLRVAHWAPFAKSVFYHLPKVETIKKS